MKNLLAKRVKKNNKGFTLVELIIVIAIIAILVAVLAPNYVRYVDRSRWSSDRNDCESLLGEVRNAIVEAQNDNDGVDASKGTITVSSSGTTYKDVDQHILTALSDADANWNNGKVKHKNKQSMPGDSSGAAKDYKTYTITLSDGGAKGEWSKD
jgi:type IV pilus assembly protein PilA